MKVVPLFATAIVRFDVPNADSLNMELRQVILDRAQTHPGPHQSNRGCWQSSGDMDRWGGGAAIRLLAHACDVASQMTTDAEGDSAVTWSGNMWATIIRGGDATDYHSHPGSYWSGVYYVDDGGIAANQALGGELEFLDPRGAVPLMNAPHLRIAGHLSAGSSERLVPQAGRMVLFPSWVLHQVRPYSGTADRISVAFNLSDER